VNTHEIIEIIWGKKMKENQTAKLYKEALQIVSDVNSNPARLDVVPFFLDLAKDFPEALIQTYRKNFPSLRFRVIEFLKQGKKIQAIKLYRDETKVDLKTAKETVEQIAQEEGIRIYPYDPQ
jgi:hypothetical protein